MRAATRGRHGVMNELPQAPGSKLSERCQNHAKSPRASVELQVPQSVQMRLRDCDRPIAVDRRLDRFTQRRFTMRWYIPETKSKGHRTLRMEPCE